MNVKKFDEGDYRHDWELREYTYDYPTLESTDRFIENFVERKRNEYYSAWFVYVSDFD